MDKPHESGSVALAIVSDEYGKEHHAASTHETRNLVPREEFLQRLYEVVECEVADRVSESRHKAFRAMDTFIMPGGSSVECEQANEQQWAEAEKDYVENNLRRAARTLQDAVEFLEAEYYFRQM